MKALDIISLNDFSIQCIKHVERRSGSHRRTVSSSTHHHRLVGGRRKSQCRRSEQINYFVDLHNPVHFAVVSGIMLLSVMDALMTTLILSVGGEELNLLMAWVIEQNIHHFVNVKLALTGLGLILLTPYMHFKVFNLFKVYHFMLAMFSGYTVLIAYEISCFI